MLGRLCLLNSLVYAIGTGAPQGVGTRGCLMLDLTGPTHDQMLNITMSTHNQILVFIMSTHDMIVANVSPYQIHI